ncbi:hypothetical protein GUITHDRAFT_102720 [Guillardia theta CCMP2712]|uniref:Malic enzyme NAD-binding domain-containing protein n=1 Tax=Guillardia theta (strain CCMP2712) TaxID=905079 RepID=L1JTP6_GUITC|nr:hypothetical protein GUITHDRAFT_102720 [Guillardia theta CCMP2712]EKX51453.1 hypothetical protein GUITHDRAFT_102720 [Guillardia theta CCMP2712]|eukprot:XP_005838433.1 hypothetical protein GUITHDRAFT_102720 [Guillardia theta CCMP2712]
MIVCFTSDHLAQKGLYTLEDRHHYDNFSTRAQKLIMLARTPSKCVNSRGGDPSDDLDRSLGDQVSASIAMLPNCNGKTLYVGGDDPLPYRPLGYEGVALIPSRATSLFVYPGISLATFAAGISSITPSMLQVAAETLARMASIDEISYGSLFPRLSLLKDISVRIAAEIIRVAQKEQKTNKVVPEGYKELLSFLQSLQDLDADDELVSSYSWQEGEKVEVKVGGEEGAFLAGAGGLTKRIEL